MLVPWGRQLIRDTGSKARLGTNGRTQAYPSALWPSPLPDCSNTWSQAWERPEGKTLPDGLFSVDFF